MSFEGNTNNTEFDIGEIEGIRAGSTVVSGNIGQARKKSECHV
jgi:hypothetical protein